MAIKEDIKNVVAAVLRKQVPNARVLSINIHDDPDDEDMMLVNVVFDTTQELDRAKLAEVPVAVVDALRGMARAPFPVLSFIDKADLGKRKPEAA